MPAAAEYSCCRDDHRPAQRPHPRRERRRARVCSSSLVMSGMSPGTTIVVSYPRCSHHAVAISMAAVSLSLRGVFDYQETELGSQRSRPGIAGHQRYVDAVAARQRPQSSHRATSLPQAASAAPDPTLQRDAASRSCRLFTGMSRMPRMHYLRGTSLGETHLLPCCLRVIRHKESMSRFKA